MDYKYIEYLGICLTSDDHYMNKVNFVEIINQLQEKESLHLYSLSYWKEPMRHELIAWNTLSFLDAAKYGSFFS